MLLTRLITLRSISTRRLRSFLTLCGIILGVAGICAINSTNQNAYLSITRLFEGTSGRVSLEVRSAANVGGIPQELLEITLDTAGVDKAVPILKFPAALPGETPEEIDINFFGPGAGGLMLHGIDPEADPEVREYRITQGQFLSREPEGREVVLVEDYALENDIDNPEKRQECLTHAANFTWEKCAHQTYKVYQAIARDR